MKMQFSLIRGLFVVVLAITFSGCFSYLSNGYAQNRIFLTPNKTQNDKAKQKRGESAKPRIFLKQDDAKAPIYMRPKSSPSRQNKSKYPRPVFQEDLSIYRTDVFKNLDPGKLTSSGDTPSSAEELMAIAAAHRIPRMLEMREMHKNLNKPEPVIPKYRPVSVSAKKAKPEVAVDGSAGVSEKKKKSFLPRLFGGG